MGITVTAIEFPGYGLAADVFSLRSVNVTDEIMMAVSFMTFIVERRHSRQALDALHLDSNSFHASKQ